MKDSVFWMNENGIFSLEQMPAKLKDFRCLLRASSSVAFAAICVDAAAGAWINGVEKSTVITPASNATENGSVRVSKAKAKVLLDAKVDCRQNVAMPVCVPVQFSG